MAQCTKHSFNQLENKVSGIAYSYFTVSTQNYEFVRLSSKVVYRVFRWTRTTTTTKSVQNSEHIHEKHNLLCKQNM